MQLTHQDPPWRGRHFELDLVTGRGFFVSSEGPGSMVGTNLDNFVVCGRKHVLLGKQRYDVLVIVLR